MTSVLDAPLVAKAFSHPLLLVAFEVLLPLSVAASVPPLHMSGMPSGCGVHN